MIWLVEHADGEVKISDENRSVVFQSPLRQAAFHLAYCLEEIRVLKSELANKESEIGEIRRHNADLSNENQSLKTQALR